jgi:hypothetical protein
MWLYVPNTSTSSPSAPEEPALISASNWQFQALEASVWSRGKPSRSRNWYQLWKRASWLQRLYGAMPEPSTAAHGVALWTASLVASRASLIASPAASKGRTTPETSGLTLGASSSNLEHGSSSSRTSPACSRRGLTKSLARTGFAETFISLATRWREDCSRRQKSARAINASGSSSSAYQGSAWPTPTANDWKGSGPTLERSDGQMRGDRLDYATEQLWSTPRASDAEKGGPNQSFGAGGQPLPSQAAQWATPRVSSERTSSIALERPDSVSSLSIAQQAEMVMGEVPREIYLVSEKTQRRLGFDPSSLPVQVTVKTGKPHSKERRSLNPLFVEWLMGWPPGWTLLAWTDFACSATELSLWRQRMRSALLSLGLPREAPPAQLALFG